MIEFDQHALVIRDKARIEITVHHFMSKNQENIKSFHSKYRASHMIATFMASSSTW